ncbi:MAG: GNAT family N-acetyltransferase [Candidatus Melainabacteria bacterium]
MFVSSNYLRPMALNTPVPFSGRGHAVPRLSAEKQHPAPVDRLMLRFGGPAKATTNEPLAIISGRLEEARPEDTAAVLNFLAHAARPAEKAVTRDIRPLLRERLQDASQKTLLRNMGLEEIELESEDTVLSGLARVYAERVINNPRGTLLLARNEHDQLVGAVCLKQFEFADRAVSRPETPHAWLNNLEIDPMYAHSPLRETLLQKALNKAGTLGYTGVSACVLPVNRPLFDANGFIPWEHQQPPVPQEEAQQAFQALTHIPGHPILMVRTLTPPPAEAPD